MLVIVLVSTALCAIAVVAIAKVVQAGMHRLGLDLLTVLLWCGLAEWPSDA
ncbi:MAG TPA: hypothetical protein VHH12_06960 [Mycobacterium sp.]|nr:hypothetical protein [Mycobacterium sp.]